VDFSFFYIEVLNHAMTTGDVEGLDEASWPNCVGCTGVIDHIREIYAAGGSARGGEWRPRMYSAIQNDDETWTVAVTVKQRAQVVRRSGDAQPLRVDPDRYTMIVDVTERRSGLGIGRLEVQM
jgi:hypothetical protein